MVSYETCYIILLSHSHSDVRFVTSVNSPDISPGSVPTLVTTTEVRTRLDPPSGEKPVGATLDEGPELPDGCDKDCKD